ncbi:MAG: hypothetical protein ACYC6I_00585 [Bacillota bacterium]
MLRSPSLGGRFSSGQYQEPRGTGQKDRRGHEDERGDPPAQGDPGRVDGALPPPITATFLPLTFTS